jgi:hypothetical protein
MAAPISRTRNQVSEITHLAPIKPGIVQRRDGQPPLTYADRLKFILEAFNRREEAGFPSVIRLFRGIHFAQWALIDGDTRLMLNVTFDGDWRDYLRSLVEDVPAFLHLIWSNCEGWEPVQGNPEALFSFIRAYQTRVSFFYAHHPQYTVRDIDRIGAIAAGAVQHPLATAAEVCASVERAARPVSFASRQQSALAQFDASPPRTKLETAKRGFTALIGSLYADEEYRSAFRESFGNDPGPAPAPPVGGQP